jgi:hypothetical protein
MSLLLLTHKGCPYTPRQRTPSSTWFSSSAELLLLLVLVLLQPLALHASGG